MNSFLVNFIERKESDSPSIERVFGSVASELAKIGVSAIFQKLSYGNRLWDIVRNLLSFKALNADIFHVTGHANYIALLLPPDRTVATFHDVTLLRYRSGIRRFLIERLFFIWPLRRAKYVTAISLNTKTELESVLGEVCSKIRIIENPLTVSINDKSSPFNDEKPVLLQIGTAENKNLDRLIDAVSGIPCSLHIIGRLSGAQIAKLKSRQIDFVNDERLSDEEILGAYDKCDIVTFCSVSEGFGLPILEAQARRKPVVTSNLSPMKDVAGGAALIVDPCDVNSIRNGILSVIQERHIREALVLSGIENVSRFAPAAIAEKYRNLYLEILSSPER